MAHASLLAYAASADGKRTTLVMAKNISNLPADLTSDHHVHTRYCNHAIGEMEDYVLSALSKGLKKITFLEHMEEGVVWQQRTWLTEQDFVAYFSEGKELQRLYQGKIEISLGVECGYNPETAAQLKARLQQEHWDEIGISCHFLTVPGQSQHLNLFSRRKNELALAQSIGPEYLLSRYFGNLTEAVESIDATVLCHLDGALRHLPSIHLTGSHYKQIDNLLQLVAKKNMKIEINTSGLRIRGEQFPAGKILEMALSYNVPVQPGSDAHKPEDVGYKFDALPRVLHELRRSTSPDPQIS